MKVSGASGKIVTARRFLSEAYASARRELSLAHHAIQAYRASPQGTIKGLAREAIGIEDSDLETAKIAAVAEYLAARLRPRIPKIIVVAGTILRDLGQELKDPVVIPYREIPHLPCFPNRKGGERKLVVGNVGDKVVVFIDKFHLCEGVTPNETVRLLRALVAFRARYLMVINSAGSVSPEIKVGDLVLVRDGVNLMGESPLRGPHIAHFGERCPRVGPMFEEDEARQVAEVVARGRGIPVKSGVYGAVLGPELGTKAALEAYHRLGIDMVGMSTMPEIIATAQMSNYDLPKLLAISLITDSVTEDFDILDRSMYFATPEQRALRDNSVANLRRLVVGTIQHLPVILGRGKAAAITETYSIGDAALRRLFSPDNLYKVYNGDPTAVEPQLFVEIMGQKDVGTGSRYHRWDVSMHSIKTVEKLLELLTLKFIEDHTRRAQYQTKLDQKIGELSITDLVVIAALFHDIGKKKSTQLFPNQGMKNHVPLGLEIMRAERILERFGLTGEQQEFVLGLIEAHHQVKPEEVTKDKVEELRERKHAFLEAISLLTMADAFACRWVPVPAREAALKELIFV